MATLCVTDSHLGSIDRYEISAPKFERTHGASFGKPVSFTQEFVERFRVDPPDSCRVEPPPEPTNPPADSGQLPCDVERQAA